MTDTGPDPSRSFLMKTATYAAVTTALVMIAMKLGAWFLTDSVAMLGSLVDSSLDAFASIVNLLAVRQALVPADKEHRFGHGKAEAIAGLGQGALIIGSALFLFAESLRRVFNPVEITHSSIGISVVVISIVMTLALVAFQSYVVRRTNSLAIKADSLHYRSDLLMNLGVIAALVLTTYVGWWWADALFGVFVALVVGYAAWMIVRQSYDQLMDRELADEVREEIIEEVFKNKDVLALHDMKTRAAGTDYFIQIHLELDPGLDLYRAHKIADEVELALARRFPGAEVLIHQDPLGIVPEDYPGRVMRADM